LAQVSIIIPTYNPASYLAAQLQALQAQSVKDADILLVDSSSTDNVQDIAARFNVRTLVIPKSDFDHGQTRTMGGKQTSGGLLVYMTQDALPTNDRAIENLIKPLQHDESLGAVFGRQIPHPNATPFARHLRTFNYPDRSYTRTFHDRSTFGLKTAFCSNSFAAYRRSTLEHVGWFKDKLIMGEDIHICARMLMKGYGIGYVADAMVYHSHNYSLMQELKRYFDLGAFLARERWILEEFGKPEGEGIRFLKSEMSFLLSQRLVGYLPFTVARGLAKLIGYKLGHYYDRLPRTVVKHLSMHAN
jgi:rhamnosyltransferase